MPQISKKQRIAYPIPIPEAGSPVVKPMQKLCCAIIPVALLILTEISVQGPYSPPLPCLFSLFRNNIGKRKVRVVLLGSLYYTLWSGIHFGAVHLCDPSQSFILSVKLWW